MRESDAGDFQIQRANTHPLAAEVQKEIGGFGSPGQNDPVGKDLNLPLELGIGADLAMGVVVPAYLGEPASHLFFDSDDADGPFPAWRSQVERGDASQAAESRSHSEKWSVSRTSNLFFVGLLLPILSSEPDSFLELRVVLECAVRAPRILGTRGQAGTGA